MYANSKEGAEGATVSLKFGDLFIPRESLYMSPNSHDSHDTLFRKYAKLPWDVRLVNPSCMLYLGSPANFFILEETVFFNGRFCILSGVADEDFNYEIVGELWL